MRVVIVYRVFPEAVMEVKKPVSVAHIPLLSDSYQVVGEYPDLSRPASPENYNREDIALYCIYLVDTSPA